MNYNQYICSVKPKNRIYNINNVESIFDQILKIEVA
jgi:hypothetical protein